MSYKKVENLAAKLGVYGGAVSFLVLVFGGGAFVVQKIRSAGEVSLPATYASESWRPAKWDQYAWLAHRWCYPTLPNFQTEYRLAGRTLQHRNVGASPDVDTGWIDTKVYVNQNDLIRIWHDDGALPGAYIRPAADDKLSFYENDRSTADSGQIFDGDRFLALSCTRCRISSDGLTYSCK
ncbi:hypothetical protein [Hyphococcus luteus]|uniref:Uncharacterized protein n=1 Tax=Hyphococcus luteus TaxID=2058213 RepID=A0A2S7K5F9_9PROT|nr:hypothetical protein [Marinicaulis flavus]PQA87740.1 hypothetical protein CW354_05095 [Marinicaulis flavus]